MRTLGQSRVCRTTCRSRRCHRRGAIIPLVAVCLVVLLVMAVLTVDVAYMQLCRTELRATADAAAKAGVEALARNQDQNKAIEAAIDFAKRNQVAGKEVKLRREDIVIGTSSYQTDGSWAFTAGGDKPNAVRVNGRFTDDSSNGSIPLFLAGMFGSGTFKPEQQATAASLELEVCLAIDRSHSMCFDLSGDDWSYPKGTPTKPHTICYPPHPSQSRWADLDSAVDLFLKTASKTFQPPRVALTTWGSEIGTGSTEYYYTHQTAPAVFNDAPLSTNYTPILDAIHARGQNVMLGGTNMSGGMDAAVAVLTANNTRPYARKIMILMTDGQWNQGRDPVLAAQDAANAGIIIHTVSFLQKTDQTTMKAIADKTGGRHFHADDGNQLRSAFEELARTLPIVLTQ